MRVSDFYKRSSKFKVANNERTEKVTGPKIPTEESETDSTTDTDDDSESESDSESEAS